MDLNYTLFQTLKIDMIISLKQNQVSSMTETYKKISTNHKPLCFQDLCKENDFLKLGKFVVYNLRIVKLSLKLQNIFFWLNLLKSCLINKVPIK